MRIGKRGDRNREDSKNQGGTPTLHLLPLFPHVLTQACSPVTIIFPAMHSGESHKENTQADPESSPPTPLSRSIQSPLWGHLIAPCFSASKQLSALRHWILFFFYRFGYHEFLFRLTFLDAWKSYIAARHNKPLHTTTSLSTCEVE
jgi:hypothetical protein